MIADFLVFTAFVAALLFLIGAFRTPKSAGDGHGHRTVHHGPCNHETCKVPTSQKHYRAVSHRHLRPALKSKNPRQSVSHFHTHKNKIKNEKPNDVTPVSRFEPVDQDDQEIKDLLDIANPALLKSKPYQQSFNSDLHITPGIIDRPVDWMVRDNSPKDSGKTRYERNREQVSHPSQFYHFPGK